MSITIQTIKKSFFVALLLTKKVTAKVFLPRPLEKWASYLTRLQPPQSTLLVTQLSNISVWPIKYEVITTSQPESLKAMLSRYDINLTIFYVFMAFGGILAVFST